MSESDLKGCSAKEGIWRFIMSSQFNRIMTPRSLQDSVIDWAVLGTEDKPDILYTTFEYALSIWELDYFTQWLPPCMRVRNHKPNLKHDKIKTKFMEFYRIKITDFPHLTAQTQSIKFHQNIFRVLTSWWIGHTPFVFASKFSPA
jgi:hypothetical protein